MREVKGLASRDIQALEGLIEDRWHVVSKEKISKGGEVLSFPFAPGLRGRRRLLSVLTPAIRVSLRPVWDRIPQELVSSSKDDSSVLPVT